MSDFFERGSLGYSATPEKGSYAAVELRTHNWSVEPVNVASVESSFFDDRASFPSGSVELDNALLMQNVDHSWHARSPLDPGVTTPQRD